MRKMLILLAMLFVSMAATPLAFAEGEVNLTGSESDPENLGSSGEPIIEVIVDTQKMSDLADSTVFNSRKAALGGRKEVIYGDEVYFAVRIMDASGQPVSGVRPEVYINDHRVDVALSNSNSYGVSAGVNAYLYTIIQNHFKKGENRIMAVAEVNGQTVESNTFTLDVAPLEIPTTTTLRLLTSSPQVGQPCEWEIIVSHDVSTGTRSKLGLPNRFFAPGATVKLIDVDTGETLATGTLEQDTGQRAKAVVSFVPEEARRYTVQARFEGEMIDAIDLLGSGG